MPVDAKNLKSVLVNPADAIEKVENEIAKGRIAGPFRNRPISNLRCSPIGLVPKKTSGLRLITNLSYPQGNSVNDFIDENFTSVSYSSFDTVVSMVQKIGKGALIGKKDIKSAFRLLPCYPGDFDLLGFKIEGNFYIDKCLPMGYSGSCQIFEKFSTFLQWLISQDQNSLNLDHYLDDFFFCGRPQTSECEDLMSSFSKMCSMLGVPVADEKTEGPITSMEYLGLLIDTQEMLVKIPHEKLKKLLEEIDIIIFSKKVTLKQLQSLCGLLSFCTRALPSGRAFSRRLFMAMSKVSKPFHFIRVTKGMFDDLLVWKYFLENFNGNSYILDADWISNCDMELFTDSAGGNTKGCGIYFQGKWCVLNWPKEWENSEILKDITYLEIIPIALAVMLWGETFYKKKINFQVDNMAVVFILNSKTSKSERVLKLLRFIVYQTLAKNFHIKCSHISGKVNIVADALSRGNFQKFRQLAPHADKAPTEVPLQFWELLQTK